MSDDLVKRLHWHRDFIGTNPWPDGYPFLREVRDRLGDAADRIEQLVATNEQLTAKLADAMDGLEKCQAELDEYSRQEYPLDHSVHERYRQRDYNANPARITLAALKGETP